MSARALLLAARPAVTAEAIAWRAQVVTNGGTVSDVRFNIADEFVRAEMAAGTWALTDDYWSLWAENAPQALTSLKQRRLATVTAAPVLTVDRGYTFNGTSQFVNTGFVPGTNAVAMTGTNLRLASYERTNITGGNVNCGSNNTSGATPGMWVGPRSSGTSTLSRANSGANLVYTLLAATSLGYTAVSLNGTTLGDHKTHKNGVSLVFLSGTPTFQNTLPTAAIYIGGTSVAGALTFPRATSVGFVATGASLTTEQELAQYNNVQAWATAVGANV